jgi:fucose permease
MFMATFWAFMMGCLIIGNGLAAYVMKEFKASAYYLFLTGFCLLGSLFFLLLPRPIAQSEAQIPKKSNQSIRETWDLLRSKRMLTVIP